MDDMALPPDATLADAGVQSVTLMRGEDVVYGPMSLSPAD